MSLNDIVQIMRSAMQEIITLIAPILGAALVVGFIVSILQAVTSIQEQTLTFLPKLITVLVMIALLSGFMFSSMGQYTINLFKLIPEFAK